MSTFRHSGAIPCHAGAMAADTIVVFCRYSATPCHGGDKTRHSDATICGNFNITSHDATNSRHDVTNSRHSVTDSRHDGARTDTAVVDMVVVDPVRVMVRAKPDLPATDYCGGQENCVIVAPENVMAKNVKQKTSRKASSNHAHWNRPTRKQVRDLPPEALSFDLSIFSL